MIKEFLRKHVKALVAGTVAIVLGIAGIALEYAKGSDGEQLGLISKFGTTIKAIISKQKVEDAERKKVELEKFQAELQNKEGLALVLAKEDEATMQLEIEKLEKAINTPVTKTPITKKDVERKKAELKKFQAELENKKGLELVLAKEDEATMQLEIEKLEKTLSNQGK